MEKTLFKKGRVELVKRNDLFIIWINGGPTYGMTDFIFQTKKKLKQLY